MSTFTLYCISNSTFLDVENRLERGEYFLVNVTYFYLSRRTKTFFMPSISSQKMSSIISTFVMSFTGIENCCQLLIK